MAIFQNNLKRLFKNKVSLILMFSIPLIFITLTLLSTGDSKLKVGVIDKDQTPFTLQFTKAIKQKAEIVDVSETNYRNQLIDGKVDFVVMFPSNFTNQMINGNPKKLQSYQIKETNISSGMKTYVGSYMYAASTISKAAQGDETKFYSGIDQYEKGNLHLKEKSISKDHRQNVVSALGFVVYGILLLISIISKQMMTDKDNRVYHRFFTTPLTLKSYNLQYIMVFVVFSIFQILILLTLMVTVFNADLGPSLFNVFLVLFLISLVSIAIGILVSALASNAKQAAGVSILLTTPLAMLSGCFWPVEIMPDFLQKIADFSPATWALKALKKLVYGNDLSQVGLEVLILAGFAVAFFLLASWKTEDIAK